MDEIYFDFWLLPLYTGICPAHQKCELYHNVHIDLQMNNIIQYIVYTGILPID